MPVLGCPQVSCISPWQAGALGQWVLGLNTFRAWVRHGWDLKEISHVEKMHSPRLRAWLSAISLLVVVMVVGPGREGGIGPRPQCGPQVFIET